VIGTPPTNKPVLTYGGRPARRNGQKLTLTYQNSGVKVGLESGQAGSQSATHEGPDTAVLVAVESAQVREALVAMLGAIEGFRIVAEPDTADATLDAARHYRPRLALIEPELSNCGGWWAIQQIQAEQLAGVVVALGRRANDVLAQLAGAQSYVQIGIAPRDLLSVLETAIGFRTPSVSGASQAEGHDLADADTVLNKPALIDL
jgi:DNA-binding NtrC family response regulator